MRNQSL